MSGFWRIPKMWNGSEVWIIGGGPSVPIEFGVPARTILNVQSRKISPKAYTPYIAPLLKKKHVIGINAAFLMLEGCLDILFFGDDGFYDKHYDKIQDYNGLKITCATGGNAETWALRGIKQVKRDNRHITGISPRPGFVSWNENSGAAAISLAAHTGAKRIVLVGFDMNTDSSGFQHWHGLYRGPDDKLPARRLPFHKHLEGFPQIAKDAREMGIEIINASPESKINQFQKTSVKELL